MQSKEEKLAKAREYKLRNRDKIKKANKDWYERNKPPAAFREGVETLYKRERSRQAAGRAIRKGLISKIPCEVCGNVEVEAHHVDYSYPLQVIWLCQHHHRVLHAEHKSYAQIQK